MPRIAASFEDANRHFFKTNNYATRLYCSGSSNLEVDCLQIRYLLEDLATTEVTKVPCKTLIGKRQESFNSVSCALLALAWCRHAGSEAQATPSEPA